MQTESESCYISIKENAFMLSIFERERERNIFVKKEREDLKNDDHNVDWVLIWRISLCRKSDESLLSLPFWFVTERNKWQRVTECIKCIKVYQGSCIKCHPYHTSWYFWYISWNKVSGLLIWLTNWWSHTTGGHSYEKMIYVFVQGSCVFWWCVTSFFLFLRILVKS